MTDNAPLGDSNTPRRHPENVRTNRPWRQPLPKDAEPQISGIPISKFGTHDALTARLEEVTAERDRLRKAVFAVRRLIRDGNPCHDGMREALLDALVDDEQ